jgi:hypothetical protein
LNNKSSIRQKGETNLAIQNSEVYITVSIYDEIDRLVREGKIYEVADRIKHLLNFVGTKHPLFPHYRYKPAKFGEITVLEHDPITEEAHEKYPLSYRGRFNIAQKQNVEGKDIHQLIEDAYFKQQEIEINMLSLTTWLGNQPVVTPNLEEVMKDGKWVIVPRELPEPMKLKLYIKKAEHELSIVDYLEIGVCGKEEGKFILLDNSRQENSKLLITLKIPLRWEKEMESNKTKDAKINVKIKPEFESDVEANRTLLQFLKQTSDGKGTLAFKNLQTDKDFIAAPNFCFDGERVDLEKDLSFIERLYKLENHYGIDFYIPEQLDKTDWEGIQILEHAMEKKPMVHTLDKLTFELSDLDTIGNIIELFDGDESVRKLMVQQTGSSESWLELFGTTIPIEKLETFYNSLMLEDIGRLKNKLEFMDEGESIKINLLPGEDPIYNEYYYFKIN